MEIIREDRVSQYLIREKDPVVKLRLIALNLVGGCEMSVKQAAEAIQIPVSTVSEWILAWNIEGYRGISQNCPSASNSGWAEEEDFVACSYLQSMT